MRLPRFSIIIDNYNYGRFLADAIDSALSQSYSNTEIIVVDDGSTDHSHEVIARYGGKVIPVLKQNGGQASAFNAGFAASSGDLICFLDADDIMLPHRVETSVDILNTHPTVGWCYHQLGLMDEAGKALSGIALPDLNQTSEFDLRSDMQQGSLKQLPLPLPGIVGLTFRRSHLEKILPMPESDGISLSDSYVQFASCATSPGVAFGDRLEIQRIHGNNSFTLRADRHAINARIHFLTAYWLRINFPFVNRFANRLFSSGLRYFWRTQAAEAPLKADLDRYLAMLTLTESWSVRMRASVYYFLKPL